MNDMNRHFDLLVVGTGPAGTTAAVAARTVGLKTAVVDRGPFGGTCVLRGCNPKKVLTGASELMNRIAGMNGNGLKGDCNIDWPRLIEFKNTFTDPAPKKRERSFSKRGIKIYHGRAMFIGRNTLDIGGRSVSADKILLATGAVPRNLGVEGEELLTTSDRFLRAEELPRMIVFIGGGYISFEFAHVVARTGRAAVILEATGRPLSRFDRDLVEMLIDASQKAGIDVVTGAQVHSLKRVTDKLVAAAGRNKNQLYEAGMIVHGAGRVPAIDDLDLEKGEISTGNKGIKINEYLQSVSNPSVYIAGDVNAEGIPLTPVAEMEARTAISNITGGNASKPDYRAVPSVVHTAPPLAAVGITESEAEERGLDLEILFKDTSRTKSTRRRGLTHSAIKLLVSREDKSIAGAHLLGHGADEVINLFSLAMRERIPVDGLKKVPWAFPTISSSSMWYLGKL
jgi:glutathione reductase (NADPH)